MKASPHLSSRNLKGVRQEVACTGGKAHQLMVVAPFTDTAEVIQSRLNEQEGREEFYVHYVGCKYNNTL